MRENFVNWVEEQKKIRGWNSSDLARHSGLSTSHISGVLSLQRKVGIDFCIGLSKAFGIAPEEIMRKAGLLPPSVTTSSQLTGTEWQIFNELQTVGDDFKKALLKTIKTWKLLYEELKNDELH